MAAAAASAATRPPPAGKTHAYRIAISCSRGGSNASAAIRMSMVARPGLGLAQQRDDDVAAQVQRVGILEPQAGAVAVAAFRVVDRAVLPLAGGSLRRCEPGHHLQ